METYQEPLPGGRAPEPEPEQCRLEQLQEGVVAAGDTLANLLQLFRLEALLALKSLPMALALGVARLPLLVFVWLSFGGLFVVLLYTLSGSAVWAATGLFLLQLLALGLVEWYRRRFARRCMLTETRKNLALIVESVQEGLRDVSKGT